MRTSTLKRFLYVIMVLGVLCIFASGFFLIRYNIGLSNGCSPIPGYPLICATMAFVGVIALILPRYMLDLEKRFMSLRDKGSEQ